MSSSVTHLHIIDGNDGGDLQEEEEIDWEAAVREIDVSCQKNANPSTFTSSHFTPKVFGNCVKQSTLDSFVGKLGIDDIDDGISSCVRIDAQSAQTWIYPVNVPLRDYQFAITKTALFSNTLVVLPTGLGKTLIAAVVMYNYFRWFPDGKIVFAAPSRPLVMQQIEACHNVVGIPQKWTIDMTGHLSPLRRACFWKTKRVFFVTPQVLEKDIQAGTCLAKSLVCLVIDEAHRAMGNYSYCVVVRQLMSISVRPRILALTATPGSKQPVVQSIIDNLQISTLEYRNESHPDVSPYVHNRKIELIEVALGKDAVDVNKRLLDVIRPYVARLTAIGLLQNRDYQTLSPPDLLQSREKFRTTPPVDLPQDKYGEIEAYFGALLTLYHIRKLLSSHGIRPTFEMLEEKLKQGAFARLMGKNENIREIKLLMHRSLSHGAPSPKLSKMLEILVEHFRTKDFQNSRVIIFSNFRGSVRDIMDALMNIGDIIKATEFIGQSSGKVLKGQSQKVQQAILQKFRAGGYNVIVATSIGEEGLDIMEVDLVICFDANISPLRMIQRMGRTGRKHDGRVVVLACEGSELKGYTRKQANSRTIRKHMHNGGINSFNFHSSPRMIPHIFKPEVRFVEMSIEQYVPHGKKVKDDFAIQIPTYKQKLTVIEDDLIARYFHPKSGNTGRPSLIAFPHFQAFPSRVHKVMHCHRTNMLTEAIQHLQRLSFLKGDSESSEDEVESVKCFAAGVIGKEVNGAEDSVHQDGSLSANSAQDVGNSELLPMRSMIAKKQNFLNVNDQDSSAHLCTFGSDFKSIDAVDQVTFSVPLVSSKEASDSKFTIATTGATDTLKQISYPLENWAQHQKESSMHENVATNVEIVQTQYRNGISLTASRSANTYGHQKEMVDLVKKADICEDNFGDIELSSRLTNMIEIGVVPESPISDGPLDGKERGSLAPELISSANCGDEMLVKLTSINQTYVDGSPCQGNILVHPDSDEGQTPLLEVKNPSVKRGCTSISPIAEETSTPFPNGTQNTDIKDWLLSSGEKSDNVKQVRKFKRLRKISDLVNHVDPNRLNNSLVPITNLERRFCDTCPSQIKQGKGKRKQFGNVRDFVDEEAEISLEVEESDDGSCVQESSSYDDSFIDDRTDPITSTQSEASRVDMIAFYRHSLLSQSPIGRLSSAAFTPDCGTAASNLKQTGSSSAKSSYSLQAPQTEHPNHSAALISESFQLKSEKSSVAMITVIAGLQNENDEADTRKRKFTNCQSGSIPATNLDHEFSLLLNATGTKILNEDAVNKSDADIEMFSDDQFFESLDLDAVEAQATSLLKHRSETSVQKSDIILKEKPESTDLENSPSFDLGIW
ncbi:hypothetical protein K2173_009636 [Erythroxylum novogranatense]|uniref:Uncharacterized protein n=1 Tax=Erythroxylum novogranatense TaxID=1862640 RepID=A0AAV8U4L3_9ROSI|nr:hypothetical protein K2173_009636 [Erythroxylum novogranatense]